MEPDVESFTCAGGLSSWTYSSREELFKWDLREFLQKRREERKDPASSELKLRSVDFYYGGATWNLFISLDEKSGRSHWGASVIKHREGDRDIHYECLGCKIYWRGGWKEFEDFHLECGCSGSYCAGKYSSGKYLVYYLSDIQRDIFLRDVEVIQLKLIQLESKGPRKRTHTAGGSGTGAPNKKQDLEKELMSGPEETWPYYVGGELQKHYVSARLVDVCWDISFFRKDCRKARKSSGKRQQGMKSDDFDVAGATFNLFVSFDPQNSLLRLGMNVLVRDTSDEAFHCCSRDGSAIKNIDCWIGCSNNAHSRSITENILSESDLDELLEYGKYIKCRISRQECPKTEDLNPSEISSVEADTRARHPEDEAAGDSSDGWRYITAKALENVWMYLRSLCYLVYCFIVKPQKINK